MKIQVSCLETMEKYKTVAREHKTQHGSCTVELGAHHEAYIVGRGSGLLVEQGDLHRGRTRNDLRVQGTTVLG